jgi:hypothetical protein
MSNNLTCGICGESMTTDCSCRFNRTPVVNQTIPKSLHQIINDELELWEKQLKSKEEELKLKEQQLKSKEEELILREQKINEYEKNVPKK